MGLSPGCCGGADAGDWRTQFRQVRVDRCTADQPRKELWLVLCVVLDGEEGMYLLAGQIAPASVRWS